MAVRPSVRRVERIRHIIIGRDQGGGPWGDLPASPVHRAGSGRGPLGGVAVLPSVSGVEHIRGQARGEVWQGSVRYGKVR